MVDIDTEEPPYSPGEYSALQDPSYTDGSFLQDSNIPEESNLVDVLKYSDDDLDKMREEAVMEEKEKLEMVEAEFERDKSELQRWFESEMRNIRRNAEDQIKAIENEASLAQKDSASESRKRQQEIEIKNENILNYTQETTQLQNEIKKLKEEILERRSHASELIDRFALKQLEHDQYKREYDTASKDYEAVAGSFTELHAQYNELKGVSSQMQGIEDNLLRELKLQEHNLHVWNNRYTMLKELTDQEIQKANSVFESMQKGHEHDKVITKNEIKTIELQIASATNTLELRKQQNLELNNICQELMGAFND